MKNLFLMFHEIPRFALILKPLSIKVKKSFRRAFGAFLKSCSGCEIQRDGEQEVLVCTKCNKPCGAKVFSRTSFSDCRSKTFSNNAGSLECEEPAVAGLSGTFQARCGSVALLLDILAKIFFQLSLLPHGGP